MCQNNYVLSLIGEFHLIHYTRLPLAKASPQPNAIFPKLDLEPFFNFVPRGFSVNEVIFSMVVLGDGEGKKVEGGIPGNHPGQTVLISTE